MRCVICDQDNWKDVDQYRELDKRDGKKVGMAMCNGCGFISYPNKYKSEEEILEYYRKDYRPQLPNHKNLFTGQKKLHMHLHFLKEVIQKWSENKTKPVIGEDGAAMGLVLNLFKRNIKDCQVYGTELTHSMRHVAFHEYGIRLEEKLPVKEYDLIMTFKVAEHQLDVDRVLHKYHSMLKPDGYLYISVPTWFNELTNFGLGGFDLEYYYDPNHINVWTQKLFESLLKKTGFQIIKFDNYMYGETYLCKKTDPKALSSEDFEKTEEIEEKLKAVKQAFECFKRNDFEGSLKIWANNPTAWKGLYEKNRKEIHQQNDGNGLAIARGFTTQVREACGDCEAADLMEADLLMRYGHYKEAIAVIDRCLTKKPNMGQVMMALSHCFRQLALQEKDAMKRIEYFCTARDICRTVTQVDESLKMEAYNWSLSDSCQIGIDDFVDYVKMVTKDKEQHDKGENHVRQ